MDADVSRPDQRHASPVSLRYSLFDLMRRLDQFLRYGGIRVIKKDASDKER
jgi:hypothetical protein